MTEHARQPPARSLRFRNIRIFDPSFKTSEIFLASKAQPASQLTIPSFLQSLDEVQERRLARRPRLRRKEKLFVAERRATLSISTLNVDLAGKPTLLVIQAR